jgi:hypothetical protein
MPRPRARTALRQLTLRDAPLLALPPALGFLLQTDELLEVTIEVHRLLM